MIDRSELIEVAWNALEWHDADAVEGITTVDDIGAIVDALLADLRAKVEALNGILTAKFDGGQDVLLWRSEVIALLNNEGERDGNTQEPRP